MTRPHPSECPVCEYDRQFPDFERGGWIQQDNNGPIVPCPFCNDDGAYPFIPSAEVSTATKNKERK